MIASTQMKNIEMFVFIAVLACDLLNRKFLFINIKYNKNCSKVGYFFKKIANFTVNFCKIINRMRNFQDTFGNT